MNISLSLKTQVEPNEEDSILRVNEVIDTSPVLRRLPYSTRNSIATFIVISLLIGSFFKFILYRYVLVSSKIKNGSYFKMTPINVMIFTSAIIHHITHLCSGTFYAIIIGTDLVLEEHFGINGCNATLFIGINILRIFSIFVN